MQSLLDQGVGVCRHFSLLARELFNTMAPDILEVDAEVAMVGNSAVSHAYNVLLTIGDDGKLQKQYFDITEYL